LIRNLNKTVWFKKKKKKVDPKNGKKIWFCFFNLQIADLVVLSMLIQPKTTLKSKNFCFPNNTSINAHTSMHT